MLNYEEEDRTPVGRPVFKTGEGRTTSLVGSTPTLFRHISSQAGTGNQFADSYLIR